MGNVETKTTSTRRRNEDTAANLGMMVLGAAVTAVGMSIASYYFSEPQKEKMVNEDKEDQIDKLLSYLRIIEQKINEKDKDLNYELPLNDLKQNMESIMAKIDQLDRSDERVHTLKTDALRINDKLNYLSCDSPDTSQFIEEVPTSFACPISQEIMREPVILIESGQTYEKSSIELWLKNKNTDPITNIQLNSKNYIPNYALKGAIEEWRKLNTISN